MNADDLAKILDELGQRLGPTGEHVFALAVRQVYIDSVLGLVTMVAVVVVAVVGLRRLYRWVEDDPSSYSDRDMISFLLGIVIVIVTGVAVLNGILTLSRLLNPEYAALRDLIGAVAK